jgi:hypothetical protein
VDTYFILSNKAIKIFYLHFAGKTNTSLSIKITFKDREEFVFRKSIQKHTSYINIQKKLFLKKELLRAIAIAAANYQRHAAK